MQVGKIVNIEFDSASVARMADCYSDHEIKSMTTAIGEEFLDCLAENRIKCAFFEWPSPESESLAAFDVIEFEKFDEFSYNLVLRFRDTAA